MIIWEISFSQKEWYISYQELKKKLSDYNDFFIFIAHKYKYEKRQWGMFGVCCWDVNAYIKRYRKQINLQQVMEKEIDDFCLEN